jgi:hypothetical protein
MLGASLFWGLDIGTYTLCRNRDTRAHAGTCSFVCVFVCVYIYIYTRVRNNKFACAAVAQKK